MVRGKKRPILLSLLLVKGTRSTMVKTTGPLWPFYSVVFIANSC